MVVGLTGNFGMGKSTVAAMLREMGAVILDADAIVSELLREPAVIETIRESFGDEVMEGGGLNRKRLADMIFQTPHLRIGLEDILHPLVFRRMDGELDRIGRETQQVVIVEAPILFERGYQNRFEAIITVFAPQEEAIRRLQERGITEEEARRRMESQLPIEIKKRGADFVIDNSGAPEDTRRQVEEIYRELLRRVRANGHN